MVGVITLLNLQTAQGTRISDTHSLLGRLGMVGGWSNVISGMMLYGCTIQEESLD